MHKSQNFICFCNFSQKTFPSFMRAYSSLKDNFSRGSCISHTYRSTSLHLEGCVTERATVVLHTHAFVWSATRTGFVVGSTRGMTATRCITQLTVLTFERFYWSVWIASPKVMISVVFQKSLKIKYPLKMEYMYT